MPEVNDIVAAIGAKNYILVAAIVVGVLVRLAKSDTKLPINIPPRARVWFALGLGLLSSVLLKVTAGIGWKAAVISGLGAGVTAILSQNMFIDSVAGGKEIPVPGLMKTPAANPDTGSPLPPKPNSVPPVPPLPIIMLLGVVAFLMGSVHCSPAKTAATEKAFVDVTLCVLDHSDQSPEQIAASCGGVAAEDVVRIIVAHKRAAAKLGAGPCPSAAPPASGPAK